MQEYVTPFWLLLLCIIAILIAASLYRLVTTIPVRKNGWTTLVPGTSQWLTFFGCAAFYGILSWTWIFVGSCRCDAEAQNRMSYWMTCGFGLGAIYMANLIINTNRLALRLRGHKVAYLNNSGKLRLLRTEDFRGYRRLWYGDIRLTFANGITLQIDGYAKNVDTFMQRLRDRSLVNALNPQPDPAQTRSVLFAGAASTAQPSISAAPARSSVRHRR